MQTKISDDEFRALLSSEVPMLGHYLVGFALPTAALANFFARAFSAILVIDQPTNGMVASNPGA